MPPRFLTVVTILGVLSLMMVSCRPQGNLPNPTSEVIMGPKATITGTVRDCITLRPLPGVTVKVEVQEKGTFFTSTDTEGFFLLEVPLGEATITVTKAGYERKIAWATLSTNGSVLRLSPELCPQS